VITTQRTRSDTMDTLGLIKHLNDPSRTNECELGLLKINRLLETV